MNMIRVLCLSAAIAGLAVPAGAQSILNSVPSPKLNDQAPAQRQVPVGLPGAARNRGGAAPAVADPQRMSPNEALFDAVNRGDAAAARDALSRGADIDARNELGLTPLDLSVDLGRNDLTFLLLSLRQAGSGARMAAGGAGATAAPRAAARPAPKAVAAVPVRTAPARPVAARVEQKGVQTVRYAADPGTPQPSAGFLGFGGAPLR